MYVVVTSIFYLMSYGSHLQFQLIHINFLLRNNYYLAVVLIICFLAFGCLQCAHIEQYGVDFILTYCQKWQLFTRTIFKV